MQQDKNSFTENEKKVLNIIQKDFPLHPQPYKEVAERTGLEEEKVIEIVRELKEKKTIRRIGGIFDSKSLGFESTLVALKVQPELLDEVGQAVSQYNGVTHNYQREHYFNLWFTLVSRGQEEMEEILGEIKNIPGVEKLRNLPALELFKIGVNFKI